MPKACASLARPWSPDEPEQRVDTSNRDMTAVSFSHPKTTAQSGEGPQQGPTPRAVATTTEHSHERSGRAQPEALKEGTSTRSPPQKAEGRAKASPSGQTRPTLPQKGGGSNEPPPQEGRGSNESLPKREKGKVAVEIQAQTEESPQQGPTSRAVDFTSKHSHESTVALPRPGVDAET